MFDKYSLVQRLQELPFSKKEYWVVAGGAMVLHGCEDGTRKILYKRHLILASRIAQPVMPFIRFLGKI